MTKVTNPGLDALKNALVQTANTMGTNLLRGKFSNEAEMNGYCSNGNECVFGPTSLKLAVRAVDGSPDALWFEKGSGCILLKCEFSSVAYGEGSVPLLLSDISANITFEGEKDIPPINLALLFSGSSPQAIQADAKLTMAEFEHLRKAFSDSSAIVKWNASVRWSDVSDPEVFEKIKTADCKPEININSINGEFAPFIPYDDSNSYSKVKALLSWQCEIVGEEQNVVWYKDTMQSDTFWFMPQVYRIKASSYTNAPEMTLALTSLDGDSERYKLVLGFSMAPYYHPKAKRDLYSTLNRMYNDNWCYLDYGGYDSATFEWDKEFSEGYLNKLGIKAIVCDDKICTSPDTSFTISLESSLDGIRLFREKLKNEGVYIGDVVFRTNDGLSGNPVEIRIKAELDLHKLSGSSLDVKVLESDEKKISFPYKAELRNKGDYSLEIGGCEFSCLSDKKDNVKDACHRLKTTANWPILLGKNESVVIELTPEVIKSLNKKNSFLGIKNCRKYWTELLCEPYGIRLSDSDINRFVNSVEDLASDSVDIWKLSVSPAFKWENYPSLNSVEVQLKDNYGVDETVTIKDSSSVVVTMARNISGILASKDASGMKYEYRMRSVTTASVSEWTEWRDGSNFETTLYIFNKDIDTLLNKQ